MLLSDNKVSFVPKMDKRGFVALRKLLHTPVTTVSSAFPTGYLPFLTLVTFHSR
jgi:hypothetical protein